MEPVVVNIEKDKINDLSYIQDKVLGVCLQTLYELAKHTDKEFEKLAKDFLPVEDDKKDNIIKTFLATYETNLEDTRETPTEIVTTVVEPPTKTNKKRIFKKKKKKNTATKVKEQV